MAKFVKTFITILLLVVTMPVIEVFAAPISYDSSFQIGTILYSQGNQVEYAVKVLKNSSFDWVAIEVDWDKLQPELSVIPDFSNLKKIYDNLNTTDQKFFIRLVNPPQWSQTDLGPDVNTVINFIQSLFAEMPSINSIEVFPGANSSMYWGNNPSAEHYMNLLKSITTFFSQTNKPVTLIAGGLIQIPTNFATTVTDTEFLSQLYTLGLRQLPVIISIQFEFINNSPEVVSNDPSQITLRHYEQIRQIMVNNQDFERQIWVTRLQPPSSLNNETSITDQAIWLQNAITQIRSQLYIQLCVLQPINTKNETSSNDTALISSQGELNPIIELFPFYALKLNNSNFLNITKSEKQNSALDKNR